MADEQPRERATPTHRVHGIVVDLDGSARLTLIRQVGRRESLVDVELDPIELVRLVEQGAGALRQIVAPLVTPRG